MNPGLCVCIQRCFELALGQWTLGVQLLWCGVLSALRTLGH